MKYFIFLILLTVVFSCTTTQQPIIEVPFIPKATETPVTADVEVRINSYGPPENFEEEKDLVKAGENPQKAVAENRERYTIQPQKFESGAVVQDYLEDYIYEVYLTEKNITDIQLQKGEVIVTQPVIGNRAILTIEIALDGLGRPHIYLKAKQTNRKTTLTINTNKRVYFFVLFLTTDTYMTILKFNYPYDEFKATVKKMRKRENRLTVTRDFTRLNFGYEILAHDIHKPSWMPSVVFDDEEEGKTYIYFPGSWRASYAPVLFLIENGKRIIANYRVSNSFYVVDQLFERAELVVDINNGNIISIKRIK